MSANEILQRLRAEIISGAKFEWTKVRDEISDEYDHASTEERVTLLQIYHMVMDTVERQLGQPDLAIFRTARRQDYNRLLISECIVNGGDISPEAMGAVTQREIAASRMAPDDEMRRLAIASLAGLTPNASFAEPTPLMSGWRKATQWLSRHK